MSSCGEHGARAAQSRPLPVLPGAGKSPRWGNPTPGCDLGPLSEGAERNPQVHGDLCLVQGSVGPSSPSPQSPLPCVTHMMGCLPLHRRASTWPPAETLTLPHSPDTGPEPPRLPGNTPEFPGVRRKEGAPGRLSPILSRGAGGSAPRPSRWPDSSALHSQCWAPACASPSPLMPNCGSDAGGGMRGEMPKTPS